MLEATKGAHMDILIAFSISACIANMVFVSHDSRSCLMQIALEHFPYLTVAATINYFQKEVFLNLIYLKRIESVPMTLYRIRWVQIMD